MITFSSSRNILTIRDWPDGRITVDYIPTYDLDSQGRLIFYEEYFRFVLEPILCLLPVSTYKPQSEMWPD